MLSELVLDTFAPLLEPGSPRAEHAVRAIEQAWSVHLVCELDLDENRVRHDRDRPAYLASAPGLAFLASLEDEPPASLGGLVEPDVFAPGGIEGLHVVGHLPMIEPAAAARGLERFAEALAASWGMITPTAAHGAIVEQVIAPGSDDVPPTGLPRLDLAEDLQPDVPRRLGWIQYWSDAAAARIGFTGDAGAAAVRRVATGWIVQLTAEPLDLERAGHLAAVQRAYQRFAAIGRR